MMIIIMSSEVQDEFSESEEVDSLLEDNNTCNEMNDSPPLLVIISTDGAKVLRGKRTGISATNFFYIAIVFPIVVNWS